MAGADPTEGIHRSARRKIGDTVGMGRRLHACEARGGVPLAELVSAFAPARALVLGEQTRGGGGMSTMEASEADTMVHMPP